MTDTPERKKPKLGAAAVMGVLVVFIAILVNQSGSDQQTAPVPIGKPLPELLVAGWLNTDPLAGDDLADQIVVVDCWATWCTPCLASLPELKRLYQEFGSAGVEFVGITPEQEGDQIEAFLAAKEIVWPIAYGGGLTIDLLGIPGYPTLIVYGRDGRSVWSGHDVTELRGVLERELRR